ncbi:MAG: hypothetical protein AAFY84_16705 [Pseudomonadota bacterium]
MSVERYRRLIQQLLPTQGSISLSELELRIAREMGAPLARDEFDEALSQEASAELYRNGRVRMTEPNLPEADLMKRVENYLKSDEAKKALRASRDCTLVEDTSRTGAAGMGEYSRPDFLMATIRQFRYDPSAYLDLISFELKNRDGANLKGVHETLAHARFAHFSYYVIPRSRLRPKQTDDLIRACSEYDLGVITYSIGQDQSVGHFRFEQYPKRRPIDPHTVEHFIDNQLSQASRGKLIEMAKGTHG